LFIYRLLPIQAHHCLTSGPSEPSTFPPATLTDTLTSSICENSNFPSPPSPSHSFSSPISSSFIPIPESNRPLFLELRTLVISDSKFPLTNGAGNAVNRSSLFAAISTGNSLGPIEDLEFVARFCNSKSRSWRYSAACLTDPVPVPLSPEDRSAASTTKIIPFRFCGFMMLSNA